MVSTAVALTLCSTTPPWMMMMLLHQAWLLSLQVFCNINYISSSSIENINSNSIKLILLTVQCSKIMLVVVQAVLIVVLLAVSVGSSSSSSE